MVLIAACMVTLALVYSREIHDSSIKGFLALAVKYELAKQARQQKRARKAEKGPAAADPSAYTDPVSEAKQARLRERRRERKRAPAQRRQQARTSRERARARKERGQAQRPHLITPRVQREAAPIDTWREKIRARA